jgi:hypothetical protein
MTFVMKSDDTHHYYVTTKGRYDEAGKKPFIQLNQGFRRYEHVRINPDGKLRPN